MPFIVSGGLTHAAESKASWIGHSFANCVADSDLNGRYWLFHGANMNRFVEMVLHCDIHASEDRDKTKITSVAVGVDDQSKPFDIEVSACLDVADAAGAGGGCSANASNRGTGKTTVMLTRTAHLSRIWKSSAGYAYIVVMLPRKDAAPSRIHGYHYNFQL